jgi:hypothetical protein
MNRLTLAFLTAILCLASIAPAEAKGRAATHAKAKHRRHHVHRHHARHHHHRHGWHVAWFGKSHGWWWWDGVNLNPPRAYTASDHDPREPKVTLPPPTSSVHP